MKQHIHNHGKKYFTIFLVLYCLLLIFHVATIPFNGLFSYGILLTGIILAIFSHKRHGYETLILLLIHMSFEWWQHANHAFEYGLQELILSIIHAIFDGVFLWEELKAHTKKTLRSIICTCVVLGIGAMFIIAPLYKNETQDIESHQTEETHQHSPNSSLLEIFVMGGIMGCIISHVFLQKKQELS